MSSEHHGQGQRPLSWGERESKKRARQRSHRSTGAERAWARFTRRLSRLARAAGLARRKTVVSGVVYRELSGVSLRRALSETGAGVKEYEVRFPRPSGEGEGAQHAHRDTMRIRFTHRRRYADLGHDPRVRFVRSMRSVVRPGDRVLDLGCGTGAGSAELAYGVGPSGGVIAINRDGESIRYARQRYRANHLAYELGWLDTLSGELDGAFHAAVVVDLFRDAKDDPGKSRAIAELWRVIADGGAALLISSDPATGDAYERRLAGLGAERISHIDPDPVLGWVALRVFKPERTTGTRDRGDAGEA
ncbi:MAG: methyltransferase domain-containing protein [Phycisphaerales bacterium]